MLDKFRFARFLTGWVFVMATILCYSPLILPGEQNQQPPESPLNMRVAVELVTTEVVALDKKGKPIRNLKQEDFRLYEDGKQQAIESFDEVSEEAAPSAPRGNFSDEDLGRGKIVVILFDDSSIVSSHLKAARDSAAKFVNERMRPQDLFAVATFGMSLKVVQNFTRDRGLIFKAISAPAVSSAGLPRQDPSRDPSRSGNRFPDPGADASTMDARAASLGSGYQLENLLRALDALSVAVEHLKGQKSILIYSESISAPYSATNTQNIYSRTLNSAKRSNVVVYTVDPGGLNPTLGEIHASPEPKRNPSYSSSLPGYSMVNSMFQQGGSSGGGGGGGSGSSGGSTGGTSGGGTGTGGGSGSSGGSTGTGSTGSTSIGSTGRSGTYTGSTGNLGVPNADGSWSPQPSFSRQSLLLSLASETGGFSIYNTNDYDAELTKLDQQLSNYYILGFQSNNPKHDGQFRKVEVKTDLKGVTLRYRKAYLDRRPVDLLASSKQEKTLLSAMASPDPAKQLPIVFRPTYFYESSRLARVVVSSIVRTTKMELRKKGGQLGTALNIMGVAYAEDNSVSARFSETLQIAVDKEREQEFRKSTVAYRNYFKLRPGKYRLKIAASDEANNLGSTEQAIEIPVFPESGMAASSLVLAEEVSRLPDLIQNLQTRLLDGSEPLLFSGLQILPSVENRVLEGAPVPVFFKIYLAAGATGGGKLIGRAVLRNEKGEQKSLEEIPLDQNISRTSSTEYTVGLRLPFEGTAPGKYTLTIETTDGSSAQPLSVKTDLELIRK